MDRYLYLVWTLALFFQTVALPGASHGEDSAITQALSAVSIERMVADVGLLSSDRLNGRQTGTSDDELAAEYFARQLKELGPKSPLVPLAMDDSTAVTVTTISPDSSLSIEFPGRAKLIIYRSSTPRPFRSIRRSCLSDMESRTRLAALTNMPEST